MEKTGDPSLHAACFASAYESFRATRGQSPAWNGKDAKQLQLLIRSKRDLTQVEFIRRWTIYTETSERFYQMQGLSLAFFCANFDRFAEVNHAGKKTAEERIAEILRQRANTGVCGKDSQIGPSLR